MKYSRMGDDVMREMQSHLKSPEYQKLYGKPTFEKTAAVKCCVCIDKCSGDSCKCKGDCGNCKLCGTIEKSASPTKKCCECIQKCIKECPCEGSCKECFSCSDMNYAKAAILSELTSLSAVLDTLGFEKSSELTLEAAQSLVPDPMRTNLDYGSVDDSNDISDKLLAELDSVTKAHPDLVPFADDVLSEAIDEPEHRFDTVPVRDTMSPKTRDFDRPALTMDTDLEDYPEDELEFGDIGEYKDEDGDLDRFTKNLGDERPTEIWSPETLRSEPKSIDEDLEDLTAADDESWFEDDED